MIKLKLGKVKLEYYLIGLIVLITAYYIYGFAGKFIHMDEAIIGEHAYWFAKLGYVKSQLFVGMGQGYEYQQLFYHKLFVWVGALVTRVFGFSLINLRMVSLVSFLVFVVILFRYIKSRISSNYKGVFFSTLLILLVNAFIFEFSFLYRPEVMLMTIGFSSFVLLNNYIEKDRYLMIVAAGALAGLAAVVHLNGLVFPTTGFLFLLLSKRYVSSLVFGGIGALFMCLYFMDVAHPEKFMNMVKQFSTDPTLHSYASDPFGILWRFLKEHERFFHSPKEISMTILVLFSIFLLRKDMEGPTKRILLYLVILVCAMALLTHGKTSKYGIVYLPYFGILCGMAIHRALRYHNARYSLILWLAGAYLVIQLFFTSQLISRKETASAQHNILMNKIPNGSKVVGPDSFMFTALGKYNYYGFWGFIFKYEDHLKIDISPMEFNSFLVENKFEYVVLDKNMKKICNVPTSVLIENIKILGKQVLTDTERYVLIKL